MSGSDLGNTRGTSGQNPGSVLSHFLDLRSSSAVVSSDAVAWFINTTDNHLTFVC